MVCAFEKAELFGYPPPRMDDNKACFKVVAFFAAVVQFVRLSIITFTGVDSAAVIIIDLMF